LIIDTAPGAHCNVIHALLNSNKIYAVTEPTPLGAHDLEIILELARMLKIPTEIVLNKADVGNKKILKRLQEDSV
jgi:MinD superfamily P-loop ATPase